MDADHAATVVHQLSSILETIQGRGPKDADDVIWGLGGGHAPLSFLVFNYIGVFGYVWYETLVLCIICSCINWLHLWSMMRRSTGQGTRSTQDSNMLEQTMGFVVLYYSVISFSDLEALWYFGQPRQPTAHTSMLEQQTSAGQTEHV